MRNYELTCIFQSENDIFNAVKAAVDGELQNAGVTIQKEEDWNVRNLAYQVKKEDRGHFYYYEIEAEPESILTINKALKLTKGLLKFLFVNKDN